MRLSLLLAAAPMLASAFKIVMSNDDGWAEINIGTFFKTLEAKGHKLVLSAPAEDQSDTGSNNQTPTTLTGPCKFNSCPTGSPATGFNASDPRLNYVNSYPVTSMKYGAPDFAVSAPNVGWNPSIAASFSGTVGAAVYAAQQGIPAIAFSGGTGEPTAWNAPTPLYSQIYADLATTITQQLLSTAKPFLPAGVFLNVNFPEVTSTKCNSIGQFKFILTRIYPAVPFITKDLKQCGKTQLPWDIDVVTKSSGCYVSISIGDANDKTDVNDTTKQTTVRDKLNPILSCLP
ncbi:hypothetical protein HDV00_004617 [Rhizophlyctis rosea]|nr:hypothetical protein HDV00_004617 [Rhizophlyctis rosea]